MAKTSFKSIPTSPGRKKLTALGLTLPFLPATTTGSFPKTAELNEMRYKVAQKFLSVTELERKERIAAETWFREQTKLKFDVFADGEMDRVESIGFFANKIDGFESGGRVRIYGNRYFRKPIIQKKLSWKEPLLAPIWQSCQRATHAPLKAVLMGPYSLMDFSFNEFYSSREDIVQDLTGVIKKEITALVEAGARIIQINEPALTSHPEEFNLVADSLRELTKGQRPYFILHQSYGDFRSLWPKIEKLPVDNISFDGANSNLDFLANLKKHPTQKDLTTGVIDVTSAQIETTKQVSDLIKASLKVIPGPQLWISTDDGLKTLSIETAIKKMEVLTESVFKMRKALA